MNNLIQNKFLELIQDSINFVVVYDDFLQKEYLSNRFRKIENQFFYYFILDLEKYQTTKKTDDWKYDYLKSFYKNNFSFDSLIQDAISGNRKMTELYQNVFLESLIIRVSKKYKNLEMFYNIKKFFLLNKKNEILFLKNIKNKILKIDEKGHVFVYNKNQPCYLSFKNINSIPKCFLDSQLYNKIIKNTILPLLTESLNIKNNDFLYLNFLTENSIPNKYAKNTASIKDIIKNINVQLYEFEFLDELMLKYNFKDVMFLAEILNKETTIQFISFYKNTRILNFDNEWIFSQEEFKKIYPLEESDEIFKLIFNFLIYYNNLFISMKSDWKIIKKILSYLVSIKGLLIDSKNQFKIQTNLSNNILIHKSLIQLKLFSVKRDSTMIIKNKILISKFFYIKNMMQKKGYEIEIIENKRKLQKFIIKNLVFSPELFNKKYSFDDRFLISFINTEKNINFILLLESSSFSRDYYVNQDKKTIFLFKNKELNHNLFVMPSLKDKKNEIEKTIKYFTQQILKKYSFQEEKININNLF